jgi:pimeloyl-ACP methyl ester carboxylesterase
MEEGFIESKGYKVHYVKWGSKGNKILLIHSMGMDGHSMDELAESLNESQVLSLTILDHGDSETPSETLSLPEHAEIMRTAYNSLEFIPNTLIGHSVGGMMGMILTSTYPEEFNGLILVDIAPFESRRRRIRPQPPDYFDSEDDARVWLHERYPGFTDKYYDNRIKYAFQMKDEKLYLKPRGDVIRPSLNIDLWSYLEKVKIPILLLKGKESDTVGKNTIKRLKETIPNLELVVVPDTGHMIPQDKPSEFERLVKQFLVEIEG